MTRRRYDRYDTEAEVTAPSAFDLTVRVPQGWAWWLGKVAVPAGAFVATLICIVEHVPWGKGLVIVALSGVGAGITVAGLVSLFLVRDEVKAHREARQPQQTRLEVDATPPLPERQVIPVRLALTDGKHQTRHLDIDITPELCEFARRVLLWRENEDAPLALSFAEAPAKSVKFEGFLPLRDEMMARGLLRWKNANHHLSGYVFRAGFDEALAYIAGYEMEG